MRVSGACRIESWSVSKISSALFTCTSASHSSQCVIIVVSFDEARPGGGLCLFWKLLRSRPRLRMRSTMRTVVARGPRLGSSRPPARLGDCQILDPEVPWGALFLPGGVSRRVRCAPTSGGYEVKSCGRSPIDSRLVVRLLHRSQTVLGFGHLGAFALRRRARY